MAAGRLERAAAQKRRDCRKNDLFALNTNTDQVSVERVFSLDYVRSTFSPGWLRACVSSF
jgi:hypothetical protein